MAAPKANLADKPDAMTTQDAADVLGICEKQVRTLIRRKELPSLKLGRRIIIPKAKLAALLGVGKEA